MLLRYDDEKRLIYGILFKEMNGQIYTINISKGEEVLLEGYGVGLKNDITIEDIEELIQNKGLINMIENILKTL